MDRIKAFFAPPKASAEEYEPLADDDSGTLEGSIYEEGTPFSWIEYSIFALIGVAMLWAWYVSLSDHIDLAFANIVPSDQEHVPRRCTLLPNPLPVRPLDLRQLAVGHPLDIYHR
jgi:hypothetical protein